jgi:hypothetical protein
MIQHELNLMMQLATFVGCCGLGTSLYYFLKYTRP